MAIAETLRDLGDPPGALGLCAKAEELQRPELFTLAVEALARAHDTPARPLPATESALLIAMVRGGWSARSPWPFRQRIADALVAIHGASRSFWVEVANLVSATLSDKRPPGTVPTGDLTRLQTCARTLAQKAQG